MLRVGNSSVGGFAARRFWKSFEPAVCGVKLPEFSRRSAQRAKTFSPIATQYRFNSNSPEITKDIINQSEAFEPATIEHIDMKKELLDHGIQELVAEPLDRYHVDLSTIWYAFARLLTEVHDIYNVPWWLMIVGSSVVLKIIVAPFMISTAKVGALVSAEENTVDAIRKSFQAGQPQLDMKASAAMRTKINEYYKSKGINTSRNLLSLLFVIPVQVFGFLQVRGIVHSNYPGLSDEGMLWFQNLTLPDPLFLLPVLSTSISIANSKIAHLKVKQLGLEPSPVAKMVQMIIPPFLILFGCYLATFNSGLQLLIFMNASTTLVLTMAYRSASFRKLLNLPPNIGLSFSPLYSDPKKIKEAFGADFGKNKTTKFGLQKEKNNFPTFPWCVP